MIDRDQIIEEAKFIVDTKSTVRAAAQKFGISKSTIHFHATQKLNKINFVLYGQVRKVLDQNKAERHIRGGQATREKYKAIKKI